LGGSKFWKEFLEHSCQLGAGGLQRSTLRRKVNREEHAVDPNTAVARTASAAAVVQGAITHAGGPHSHRYANGGAHGADRAALSRQALRSSSPLFTSRAEFARL
jgi:hypothetical protein